MNFDLCEDFDQKQEEVMAHIKTFARPRSDVTVSDFFILSDKQVTAQFHETGVTGGTHYPITYDFQFSHVFKPAATQEDVFHKVAVETALLQQFIQAQETLVLYPEWLLIIT